MSLSNIILLSVCTPFLLYACASDIRTQRVSDDVWTVMLAGLLPFIIYNQLSNTELLEAQVCSFLIIGSITIMFFEVGIFGGADTKMMIVLSLIFPAIDLLLVLWISLLLSLPIALIIKILKKDKHVPFIPVLVYSLYGVVISQWYQNILYSI